MSNIGLILKSKLTNIFRYYKQKLICAFQKTELNFENRSNYILLHSMGIIQFYPIF